MNSAEYMDELRNEILARKGSGTEVTFHDVRKNNGVMLHACTVRENGAGIAPAVYLEPYYEDYLRGVTAADSADDILRAGRMILPGNGFDADVWQDYDKIKSRLGLKLISFQNNRDLLAEVPYMRREDMAVTVFYMLPDPVMPGGTIAVRLRDLDRWKMNIKKLFSDALVSSMKMLPPVFQSMSEMIGVPDTDSSENMYVLTNEQTVFGASCVLYPNLLAAVSERIESGFYLLPSSIHEMIVLPDMGEEPMELKQIVTDINRTEVPAEDILTDSVYYFGRGDDTFHRIC